MVSANPSREEKTKLVQSVPFWWHTIDFGDGVRSSGRLPYKAQLLRLSAIPTNLKHKTVLDIGCWDGFYSFECEKRGADVTAIETGQHAEFVRARYGLTVSPLAGFKIAHRLLNSNVKLCELDVYEVRKLGKAFDIVLMFGILYHLKHPLLSLEAVAEITKGELILETHYVPTKHKRPMMVFYPGRELNDDPTCWWGPNLPCVLELLKAAGFHKPRVFKKYSIKGDNRAIVKARKS
jgi:tRNA (mo5U34)-methyltransferase